MRLHAMMTGACAAALMLTGTAATAQSLEDGFRNPPKEARPRFRWWWPGGAVNDPELEREIGVIDAAGFGGAEIQALGPNFASLTPDERARVNDYAEPAFFGHVRAAAKAAAARGLTLDYTLGSAWPSGGGFAIPPEKAFVELTMARTEVTGGTGTPVTLTLPSRTKRLGALSMFDPRVKDPRAADWPARMDAQAKIVAVVALRGTAPKLKTDASTMMGVELSPWKDVIASGTLDTASAVVLTDKLKADGTLDWRAPAGTWQVFVFKQYASNMGVLGAAGQGPQLILDHMDPGAFAAHAARVGDPLGTKPVGIRSTFVDSLELMQDLPWGRQFLTEFRKRRGYDLTRYLPLTLQPGWMQAWSEHFSPPYFQAGDSTADRVRADYRRTVSDLMFDGFILPYVAWNHAHGLKAKFQAHGGAIDIVRGYGVVDIPETEDLVHEGDPYFMRFARSGADLYGHRIVSAESLVWKDRPYNVTPDELRRRADLIFAGGVNSLIVHGHDYRLTDGGWPGWHAFQPSPFALGFSTMFTESNPVWAGVPTLARYLGRMQSVLQQGQPIVPVAYFYGQTGYYVGIEDGGAGKQAAEKAFLSGGYDFDRINPDAIGDARVERGVLVAKGGARYPVLVLPPIAGIRAETAEAIARFARAGLRVIFTDRAPEREEGLADAANRDARVRAAVAAAMKAGARVVPLAQVVPALRTAGVPANLTFTAPGVSDVVYVQRKVAARTVTFVHNLSDAPRDAGMILGGTGGVTRWNAMDGTIAPVAATAAPGGVRIALPLAGGESALLVSNPASSPQVVAPPVVVQSVALPASGWTLGVEGHSGRQPYVRPVATATLGDWRSVDGLAAFSGVGTYRRSLQVEPGWLARGQRIVLDLGAVHDMATVTVNGRALQPLITAPFRVDVTDAVRAGANDVVIAIANTPQNAMIDPRAAGYKLLKPVPAGLVGPVVLEVRR
ncbi:hypothetical protein M9979_13635 [Sphingomonas sp. RP10(2022)]|uniref:Alpha-L-rhamnosidase n=1 Tax=Sphingomonas liriopis TaxID=2949094 RepID=A0A9X2KRC5_9SPHN|nr:glycosyl hydrolase [Sphingomonas liriopis]MCP3735912.1 hypothetical protein [Sphingomonas liriopis]